MIFARDKSQMCNNLLQFAHVYAWAREHNRSVMSMRFSYKYPHFRISRSKYVSFPLYLFAKYMAALKLIPTASFKHEDCDINDLEKKMLQHKHIVVSGWFARFYDLFIKYRSEICDLFTIDDDICLPVRQQMTDIEATTDSEKSILRLGLHIRRGDYAEWKGGIYCYSDEYYVCFVDAFARLFPDKEIHIYLSTNDSSVSAEHYQEISKTDTQIFFHNLKGSAVGDLYMLSACDYIIGPPSTFSLVAAMYRDIPLCRMDTVEPRNLTKESFRLFDHWFRHIV